MSHMIPFTENIQNRRVHRDPVYEWSLVTVTGGNGEKLLMGMVFLLEVIKMFWD